MKLLVATKNGGKVREISSLLSPAGIEVVSLADIDDCPEIIEDADTFLGNALKKAHALRDSAGLNVLADDSGLCVDALGGAPGVKSARYAGPGADDEGNMEKLLAALRGEKDRKAAFVCSMVFSLADGVDHTAEGRLEGAITEARRGTNGFGYDPVFVPTGQSRTLAEMELAEKNRISHRKRALARLIPTIIESLGPKGASPDAPCASET